ncbi:hypothetical protein SARC_13727 [Sphaeroforma arctica JP610]|uniref:Uncharacterized protein n=1 Tax=Sphaeroforma arctica JP610 TaxID=667725 RepID=A0A0L0FB38_9EUKA|nr:hypothetical protein SARC_13727 [Sphaeroforma arctica JP610]KNC73716.1 hypothetical protein SARC_13727 [Sphaeroforma arctica JP610]|eukprot:XP_014147618.1 hypothetical protein SARC_13727 [Sphaeroforma arctica JP610]
MATSSTGVYLTVEPRKPPYHTRQASHFCHMACSGLECNRTSGELARSQVFWLSGARINTNWMFACDFFTFVSASHTLLIDLKKKKRGERSQLAKIITRPLDRVTYAFLERHLPDEFRSSDSLQAPATALNNLTKEVGIITIRQHFIRAGLVVDTADKHIQGHAFRRGFSQSAFSLRVPDDIIAGIMSIDKKITGELSLGYYRFRH